MSNLDPLAVLLVTKGTNDCRILFSYPSCGNCFSDSSSFNKGKQQRNPYGILISEDIFTSYCRGVSQSCIKENRLAGLSEDILSFLLSAKEEMCGEKYELKINDVRFISHPMLLHNKQEKKEGQRRNPAVFNSNNNTKITEMQNDLAENILVFNVVFALRADAPRSAVSCFYDLSKRLAIALKHEQVRCGYFGQQAKVMIDCHEEVNSLTEDMRMSATDLIESKSALAKDLKSIFCSLCDSGIAHVFINKWIEIGFCLSHKLHSRLGKMIKPDDIERYLSAVRPYHGMLLLEDPSDVIEALPLDASPSLIRLLKIYHPSKSLQLLSCDADLPVSHVFQLVGHLVYWRKATVISPLCESNVYVISPNLDLTKYLSKPSKTRNCLQPTFNSIQFSRIFPDSFTSAFPKCCLWSVLSEFSLPTSLLEFTCPKMFDSQQQSERIRMVIWLLKHHLLMQLHTFIYISPQSHDFIHPEQANNKSKNLLPEVEEELRIHLNDAEFQAVSCSPGAQNLDDLKLFIRLCPYFRGNQPIEEAMYREDLRRSQVLNLVGKFQDVLITCSREDQLEAVLHTDI